MADDYPAIRDAAKVLSRASSGMYTNGSLGREEMLARALDAQGCLVTPTHDAKVAADALRAAADALDALQAYPDNSVLDTIRRDPAMWLVARADALHPEED